MRTRSTTRSSINVAAAMATSLPPRGWIRREADWIRWRPVAKATLTGDRTSLVLWRQLVGLGRHDEVVLVETANLMGPPGHGDAPPLGQ